MDLLCVANWSEGREGKTVRAIREPLYEFGCRVHFAKGDCDHNRLVTAFSGPEFLVKRTIVSCADAAFMRIDMRKHSGVHPRIGALDVCPFILLDGDESEAKKWVDGIAREIPGRYFRGRASLSA